MESLLYSLLSLLYYFTFLSCSPLQCYLPLAFSQLNPLPAHMFNTWGTWMPFLCFSTEREIFSISDTDTHTGHCVDLDYCINEEQYLFLLLSKWFAFQQWQNICQSSPVSMVFYGSKRRVRFCHPYSWPMQALSGQAWGKNCIIRCFSLTISFQQPNL